MEDLQYIRRLPRAGGFHRAAIQPYLCASTSSRYFLALPSSIFLRAIAPSRVFLKCTRRSLPRACEQGVESVTMLCKGQPLRRGPCLSVPIMQDIHECHRISLLSILAPPVSCYKALRLQRSSALARLDARMAPAVIISTPRKKHSVLEHDMNARSRSQARHHHHH